jgi:hypothetical protein
MDYPVWVRVECEHCGRELAELYGQSADLPVGLYWSEEMAETYPAGAGYAAVGHAVTWWCDCGPNEVKGEKLTTAFHSAALHPDPDARVIRVPRDVGEDVWGSSALGGPGGSFAVLPDGPD